MRIRIGRTIFVSAIVILCTAALALVPRAGLARSPRPCTVSIFEEMVHADPGEDPHLRAEPQIRLESIETLGSSAPPATDVSGRDLLGQGVAPSDGAVTRSSRVYSKFLAVLRTFFSKTLPR